MFTCEGHGPAPSRAGPVSRAGLLEGGVRGCCSRPRQRMFRLRSMLGSLRMGPTASRRPDMTRSPRVTVSKLRAHDGTHTVVALGGELDAAALNSLVESFDDAIEQDDSDVVIDLAGVDFIGAAWIGTFVRSRAYLATQDPCADPAGAVSSRE